MSSFLKFKFSNYSKWFFVFMLHFKLDSCSGFSEAKFERVQNETKKKHKSATFLCQRWQRSELHLYKCTAMMTFHTLLVPGMSPWRSCQTLTLNSPYSYSYTASSSFARFKVYMVYHCLSVGSPALNMIYVTRTSWKVEFIVPFLTGCTFIHLANLEKTSLKKLFFFFFPDYKYFSSVWWNSGNIISMGVIQKDKSPDERPEAK